MRPNIRKLLLLKLNKLAHNLHQNTNTRVLEGKEMSRDREGLFLKVILSLSIK